MGGSAVQKRQTSRWQCCLDYGDHEGPPQGTPVAPLQRQWLSMVKR